ncbi:hypothetical protein BS17DRAFT_722281, partial [Gyrodon lividus]
KTSLKQLLTGGPSQNLRRTTIAIVCQCCQQITGVNLITYYATLLFERLGISSVNSRIIAAANGTEYFLASFIAIALVERVGRRKLMLISTIGQGLTMVVLAILGSIDNSATQVVSAVLLFVFNTFHAIGWLAMAWLYVRLMFFVVFLAGFSLSTPFVADVHRDCCHSGSVLRLWGCGSERPRMR